MTTQELIDYYKGLLILQYASLGNALAEMDLIIGVFLQDQILQKVRDGFDLETAIGAQLNILATYRGLSRVVFGATPGNFWSLVPYGDPDPDSYFGWAEYADADPTWNWIQYNDITGVPYVLSDHQLRNLIKLKALVDSWQGGLGDLDDILYTFFTTFVNVVDNENMSITYEHQTADPDPDQLFLMAELAGILPHPSGVSFTVVEV